MEQLIELLQQIQELAGIAIDALTEAAGGAEGGPPPEESGEPPLEPGEGPPPEEA